MTTSTRVSLALLGLLVLPAAPPAAAQVRDTPAIKQKAPKVKREKFRGQVLAMTRVTLIVRDRANANLVRTFTYDEKLAPKMARLMDRGTPFQHGDVVEVEYVAGSDLALAIKGKPSRPRRGYR